MNTQCCLFPLVSWFPSLEKFPFEMLHRNTIVSLCLLKRAIKCDWLLAEMQPLGSTDPKGFGIPRVTRDNYTQDIFRNAPECSLRICIFKTVHCQDPGHSYELIRNSKTKSIQHVTCKTVKWFTSGGEVIGAHKKGSLWICGNQAYVVFQISLWGYEGWEMGMIIFFFFFKKFAFFYLFIYLFIYDCVGSSFLCEGFL